MFDIGVSIKGSTNKTEERVFMFIQYLNQRKILGYTEPSKQVKNFKEKRHKNRLTTKFIE